MFKLIKYRVPQGFILGPILFKMFQWNIFSVVTDRDIASYDNENTPYCTNDVTEALKITSKTPSMNVFQWFRDNGMKSDIDKCHFRSSFDINSDMKTKNFSKQKSESQNLLESGAVNSGIKHKTYWELSL